jgi:ribosomal protein S18 acetylase RimI-like enzyme
MNSIQVQAAQPSDAPDIANLFSSAFAPDVAQLLIHGCKGAPEHIRMQIAAGIPNAESAYFVALAPPRIVGAVELRRQANGLFLNYIAVHPGYRRQRVAATLLSAAVRMAGVNYGQIALDVLHDNLPALDWYRRLGFATTTSSEFLELAPPGSTENKPAYVSGLAQADLCHEKFGFSTFNLICGDGNFSVGRIGEKWFRLTALAAVGNASIFDALNLLDPARRVFAIVPACSAPPAQVVRLLAKTHRMETKICNLMASLS